METETIDKLFLELAQFATATTPLERDLIVLIRDLLPWLTEPGGSAPTARAEYAAVLARAEQALGQLGVAKSG